MRCFSIFLRGVGGSTQIFCAMSLGPLLLSKVGSIVTDSYNKRMPPMTASGASNSTLHILGSRQSYIDFSSGVLVRSMERLVCLVSTGL